MSHAEEKVLETIAGATQSFAPVKSICAVLNGFHNYANDLNRSVEAYHYCAHPEKDFRQCLLYDSDQSNARLIGVEYMIPISRFEKLPEEEKFYWHSHFEEVKSGLLVMPQPTTIPLRSVWDTAETEEMKELVNWMGKTYHFWQVDRGDELPLGDPQLMMSIKSHNNIDMDKVKERNRKLAVDHEQKKSLREGIHCHRCQKVQTHPTSPSERE